MQNNFTGLFSTLSSLYFADWTIWGFDIFIAYILFVVKTRARGVKVLGGSVESLECLSNSKDFFIHVNKYWRSPIIYYKRLKLQRERVWTTRTIFYVKGPVAVERWGSEKKTYFFSTDLSVFSRNFYKGDKTVTYRYIYN